MVRAKKRGRLMSDRHKASLAHGRVEGRVVRNYLDALASRAPKRGRPRTTDVVDRRLTAIEEELAASDPVRRLKLVQERRDLHAERARLSTSSGLSALEDAFVEIAASYSVRLGIGYQAWREVGVPADVLARAGLERSSR